MRCAQVIDGVVANVAIFEECPADWVQDTVGASPGWLLVDGALVAPPVVVPEMTAAQLRAHANAEARNYLEATDWYVIRSMETGEPVPAEVLAERAAARARVK